MMSRRWLIGGVGVVAVTAFLLFRPDTLFTDVEVDESLGDAFVSATTTSVVDGKETVDVTTITTGPNMTSTTDVIDTSETGPSLVAEGEFTGIDHAAQGTASIYTQDDRYVLRFEDDTDIQNGPDLFVWLLAASSYESGTPTEYLDLGTLKGTLGGQNYELPEEFDPELHRAVLIWCRRFAVPFAAAALDG